MKKRGLRGVWVIACLACLATPGRTQVSPVVAEGGGSVTIDASRLNTLLTLDAPWRFQPGDDPRFADPAFDDSGWPLVQPGVDRLLADSHAPNEPHGRGWARLHVHILNANGPLAIAMTARSSCPYAVFAQGREIGATKGFAAGNLYIGQPFQTKLPQTQDVLVAVHFVYPGGPLAHYFTLENISLGQSDAVGAFMDLQRYRVFEDRWLLQILSGLFF